MTRTPRIPPSPGAARTRLRQVLGAPPRAGSARRARARCAETCCTVSLVDVRIGVTQAPRELTIEIPDDERDDVEKQIEAALVRRRRRAVAHRQAGSRHRRAGGQDRLRRGRHDRRRPPHRLRRLIADEPAPATPRPPAALRHRQGWRRQDLGRGRARRSRRPQRPAHAGLRDGRQGLAGRGVRHAAARRSSRARSTRPVRDGDEHRGLAARVPAAVRQACRSSGASVRSPARSTSSPTPRPGVKEILSVGKLAYEVRERHYDLVVVDAEASGHIVAQIGAPRVIRELVKVGHGARPDRVDDRASSRTRRSPGVVDRHDARGDAGHRDDRPARPARPRDRRARRRRSSPTACCRRCSTAARPTVVDRLGDAERAARRRRRARRAPGRSRPPSITEARRRIGNRHLERLRAGIAADLPDALRARAVHQGRPAAASSRSWPTRSPRSWTWSAPDGHAHGRRRARPRCWRARRWCSSAARAASARRPSAAAIGARRGGRAGRPGARADRRSGQAARRRARCRRARQRRDAACPTRRSRPPASSRVASCGRRCSTPRPAGTS